MRIKQQIAHWEEKQVEVAQPKLSPELQAEIRAHMKTQNMEEKRAAVNGDIRACSAVLSGPNFLSGLDERQMDIIKLTAHEKWAPEQTASLRESQRCLQQALSH